MTLLCCVVLCVAQEVERCPTYLLDLKVKAINPSINGMTLLCCVVLCVAQEVERCPTYLLDLLTVCWSQDPADRPSAASVVTAINSPQFFHLRDILSLGPDVGILCGVAVPSADVMLGRVGSPVLTVTFFFFF